MDAKQLYWLAGLLEGEGSFGCYKSSHQYDYHVPTIQLVMTDGDVMLKASSYMGTNSHKQKVPARGIKHPYKTSLSGEAAARLMIVLYPLMGDRRQSQIVNALATYLGLDIDTTKTMLLTTKAP